MQIYLRHEKHGVKIAQLEQEAVQDEANGWVRFNPKEKPQTPAKRGRPRKK